VPSTVIVGGLSTSVASSWITCGALYESVEDRGDGM